LGLSRWDDDWQLESTIVWHRLHPGLSLMSHG
jgi:hypothetical protein